MTSTLVAAGCTKPRTHENDDENDVPSRTYPSADFVAVRGRCSISARQHRLGRQTADCSPDADRRIHQEAIRSGRGHRRTASEHDARTLSSVAIPRKALPNGLRGRSGSWPSNRRRRLPSIVRWRWGSWDRWMPCGLRSGFWRRNRSAWNFRPRSDLGLWPIKARAGPTCCPASSPAARRDRAGACRPRRSRR